MEDPRSGGWQIAGGVEWYVVAIVGGTLRKGGHTRNREDRRGTSLGEPGGSKLEVGEPRIGGIQSRDTELRLLGTYSTVREGQRFV